MLLGRKPLSVFCDEISVLPNEEIIPEERFRPYVETGRFVREETVLVGEYHPTLGRDVRLRYVLFALRAEAWRIPAFLLAQDVRRRMGRHSEDIERFESSLLGYTPEEIDAWCNHLFRCSGALRPND